MAGLTGITHPMALAMNAMGYDAMVVGNHEFNYGLPFLRSFEAQADFPLLAANVRDATTGAPALSPSMIETVKLNPENFARQVAEQVSDVTEHQPRAHPPRWCGPLVRSTLVARWRRARARARSARV